MPGKLGKSRDSGSEQTPLLRTDSRDSRDTNENGDTKKTNRLQKNNRFLYKREAYTKVDDTRSTSSDRAEPGALRDVLKVKDTQEFANLEPEERSRREEMKTRLSSQVQRTDQYINHVSVLGRTDLDGVEAGKMVEKTINSVDVTRFQTDKELLEHVSAKIQDNTDLSRTMRGQAADILTKTQQLTIRDELLTRLDRTREEFATRTDVDKGKQGGRVEKFTQAIEREIHNKFRASKLEDADTFMLDVKASLDKYVQKQHFFRNSKERRANKQDFVDKFMDNMQKDQEKPDRAEQNKLDTIAKVERLQTLWTQSMLKYKTEHKIDSYVPSPLPSIAKPFTHAETQAQRVDSMNITLHHVQNKLRSMDSSAFRDDTWKENLLTDHSLGNNRDKVVARVEQAVTNIDTRDELVSLANRNRPQEQDQTKYDQRQEKTIDQFQDTLDSVLMRPQTVENTPDTRPDKGEIIDQVQAKMLRNINKKVFIREKSKQRKIDQVNQLAADMKEDL